MALTSKQLKHRCLVGNGSAQCRYLLQDTRDWKKYYCQRQLVQLKMNIDKKIQKTLDDAKKKGIDPMSLWEPVGDGNNCQGYPCLKSVAQGYDLDQAKKKT